MTHAQPKVIVITGASSGIGAALARNLGSQGHKLVLAARREDALRRVAESVAAETRVVPTDVTIRAEVENLREQAIRHFGQVDVWINNAGRGITRPILELTDEDFDEMMRINVKSALYGIQAIVPHFQKRNAGHLINVSSFLGRIPMATFRSAYSAAKAALNSLTTTLRLDLAPAYPGIRVSLVMPGMVKTEFAKNALGGMAAPPPASAMAAAAQTPEEVAAAIAELIRNPQPEIYTNPISGKMAQRYFDDIAAFEKQMREGARTS